MKTNSQTILAAALILFISLGCNLANQITKEIEKTQAPKILTATNNKFQLTVPGSWQTRTDLHETAELQAGNLLAEQYAVVITQSKEDFTDDISLDEYSDLLMNSTKTNVSDITFSEISKIEINGLPANQYEANGSADKIKIKWIFTVIKTTNNFYQVVTWTSPSRFVQNKNILLDVAKSFKELGGTEIVPPVVKPKSTVKK